MPSFMRASKARLKKLKEVGNVSSLNLPLFRVSLDSVTLQTWCSVSSIASIPDFRLLLLLLFLPHLTFLPTLLWSSPGISTRSTLFLQSLLLASFDTCTISLGIEPSVIGPLRLWIALREQFYMPGNRRRERRIWKFTRGRRGQTNLSNFWSLRENSLLRRIESFLFNSFPIRIEYRVDFRVDKSAGFLATVTNKYYSSVQDFKTLRL